MNFGFLQTEVKLCTGRAGREATLFSATRISCPLSVPLRPWTLDICTISGLETYCRLFPSRVALDSITVTFKLIALVSFCARWTELLIVSGCRDSSGVCGTHRFDSPFDNPTVLIRNLENMLTTFCTPIN